jgi:predicted acetyltransferase
VLETVHGGSYAWIRERLGMHMEIPGYISIYVAYVDQQPASTAWIYFYPGSPFAGLWAGATLEPYRGRGLYTALLATRAQEAMRREYRYLYLNASDMSQPIVKKLGFQAFATLRAYEYSNS